MVFGKKRIKSTVTKQTKCFKLTLRISFIRATSCKVPPFCILLGYTTDNRHESEREREGERERERERETERERERVRNVMESMEKHEK